MPTAAYMCLMNAVHPAQSAPNNRINTTVAAFSGGFIAVLAVAAYLDRSIRLLHFFESFPYLIAAALCLQNRKSGYALGIAAGAFWLLMGAVLTTFVWNGFQSLVTTLTTRHLDRPDTLIAVPAAISAVGLVIAAVWGYARLLHKKWSDVMVFASAMVLVTAWFVGIFAIFAPRYLDMFKRLAF